MGSAGDSFYSIAKRFGLKASSLAEVNGLTLNQPLQTGFRLYIPPVPRRQAEVNAYIEPRGEAVSQALQNAAAEAAPELTYLAPFSFRIKRDGSLQAPPLDNLASIAAQNRVTLMLVVTNLEDAQFSSELGRIILNDVAVQDRLLENIVTEAKRLNFRDIHFDLEFLRPEDREAYNAFCARQRTSFTGRGSCCLLHLHPKPVPPKPGPGIRRMTIKCTARLLILSLL